MLYNFGSFTIPSGGLPSLPSPAYEPGYSAGKFAFMEEHKGR